MNAPLFQVGLFGTDLLQPPEPVRERFARAHAFECRAALGPELLAKLSDLLARARFEPQQVGEPGMNGIRDVEMPERVGKALRFALNRVPLFQWLEKATGCGPLDRVTGRIVQARAGHDHRLGWHDDRQDLRRRLAITINLGTAPYEGGLFEMRTKRTGEQLFTHRHTEPGTALIFDVAADIEHRCRAVTAGGPRRVFAGWFLRPELSS